MYFEKLEHNPIFLRTLLDIRCKVASLQRVPRLDCTKGSSLWGQMYFVIFRRTKNINKGIIRVKFVQI